MRRHTATGAPFRLSYLTENTCYARSGSQNQSGKAVFLLKQPVCNGGVGFGRGSGWRSFYPFLPLPPPPSPGCARDVTLGSFFRAIPLQTFQGTRQLERQEQQ